MSWLGVYIGDGNPTSVYNDPKYLTNSLTETETQTAITNQPDERRKDSNRIEYKESNLEYQILKNKSKDRDSNFLVVFSSSKA